MLKVEEAYQERFSHFIYVLKELDEIMWEAFPAADSADLNDLVQLRIVVGKAEEVLQLCRNHGSRLRMRADRPPTAG